MSHSNSLKFAALIGSVCFLLALAAACASPAPAPDFVPKMFPTLPGDSDQPRPTSTDVWPELLQRTPFPYETPLPPPIATQLDGTYARVDPKIETPVPCRRCPDYKPEGGIWRIMLDKGIYRIAHQVTGWKSNGSFVVQGDRLYLFNDPACTEDVGVYAWSRQDRALSLQVIEDACSIGLRAKNIATQPWASCAPPKREAAITDHWAKPPGCAF